MTNFGQLFASRESLAIMLRVAKQPKPKARYLRTFFLGEHRVVVDLRLLTTTTSQGI